MIQIIGLIVAVYACVRLIQVPVEHSADQVRAKAVLWVLTIVGVGAIGLLTLLLLVSGLDTSLRPR